MQGGGGAEAGEGEQELIALGQRRVVADELAGGGQRWKGLRGANSTSPCTSIGSFLLRFIRA